MKKFYGGIFMDKDKLKKVGILYPIKIEYYKTKEEGNIDIYGIEIIKTEYQRNTVKIEKENIDRITYDETEANHILDLLKKNEVTPIIAREIVQDYIKC